MKKKNNHFLQNEYRKSWGFVKESRNFIYAVILVFFITSLLGFFIPLPESLTQQILEFIQELLEKTKGMSQFELTNFIFLNNLQSSFIGMVSGILFGIYPLFATIANGFILGFVASISVSEVGFLVLWRILPHGIFELPAVFISLGLGLKLGMFIFTKNKKKELIERLIKSLKVFFLIVLPLLIIAAIIEGILIFSF